MLSYYKSDEAFRKKEMPLGSVQCAGAKGFLKEVTPRILLTLAN